MAISHPQNVQSSSILAQLDLAITLSETALRAPDPITARRNMVLARQVLDGAQRSLLNCQANAEIEIRLDRIQLLLRQYKQSYGQPEDKRTDIRPSCNHDPETDIQALPKDEPIEAAREPLIAKEVRRDTAGVLNCSPDQRKQARREHTSWQSLLLGLLNKSSAWLMSRDEPTEAPREPLIAKEVRRDTAEVLNCFPDQWKQAPRVRTPWQSLLLGLLNKSSAWLMSRV